MLNFCFSYKYIETAGWIAGSIGVVYLLITIILKIAKKAGGGPKMKKTTPAFSQKAFDKLNKPNKKIQFLMTLILVYLGIYGAAGGLEDIELIYVMSWSLYILEIFICFDVIISILALNMRRTNRITNLAQDYADFYNINQIPIVGTCRVCGRPIPAFYAFKRKIVAPAMTHHQVCFQADAQHLVALQNYADPSVLAEMRWVYKKINKIWFKMYKFRAAAAIFMVIFMIVSYEYLAPWAFEMGYDYSCKYESNPVEYIGFCNAVMSFPHALLYFLIEFFFYRKFTKKTRYVNKVYFDYMLPEVEMALKHGTQVPMNLAVPINYSQFSDEMPSFFKILKDSKNMRDNIRGGIGGSNALEVANNAVQGFGDTRDALNEATTPINQQNLPPVGYQPQQQFQPQPAYQPVQQTSPYQQNTPVQSEAIPQEDSFKTLENLKALFEQGILSEAEYKEKKDDILSRI